AVHGDAAISMVASRYRWGCRPRGRGPRRFCILLVSIRGTCRGRVRPADDSSAPRWHRPCPLARLFPVAFPQGRRPGMSTVEAIPRWILAPDVAAPPQPEARPAPPAPMRVGLFSLRQIVDAAVSRAEVVAIRRALASTAGNKSHAARLLRTNYT